MSIGVEIKQVGRECSSKSGGQAAGRGGSTEGGGPACDVCLFICLIASAVGNFAERS